MNKIDPDILIPRDQFHFQKLIISGIQNDRVLKKNSPRMAEEETCLFHRDFSSGDEYLGSLHRSVAEAISNRTELPVVRFADGEYAFYAHSLHCNGLYQQAESRKAIRKIMPAHIASLKRLSTHGKIAPLVFPGNTESRSRKLFSFIPRKKEPTSSEFLKFLCKNGISLTKDNYFPFYTVYAYLTSREFAKLMHERRLCIINSEFNAEACQRWFERRSSRPSVHFVKIPDSYLATRWPQIGTDILGQVPREADLCLVGAGVGALLIAVDVSKALSIPVIDAGHILNMMNGRIEKSNGSRLYTFEL